MDEKYISKYETGENVDKALDYGVQAMYEIETAKGSTHETLDSVIDDLQGQINQIVRAPESGGDVAAEVAQARVDANGVSHDTLKVRLDSDARSSLIGDSTILDYIDKGWCATLVNWQQGMIDGSNGVARNNSQQVYDPNFIYVGKGSHVGLSCKVSYGARINYYTSASEGSFTGHTTESYGADQIFVAEQDYIRVNAFIAGGANVTPEQMADNVRLIIVDENSSREAEIFTNPRVYGYANYDTITKILTFPQYAVLIHGNERYMLSNKQFDLSDFSSFAFILYNPSTADILECDMASRQTPSHLLDKGYVRIGYILDTVVSFNINPGYLVNGIPTEKGDGAYALFRQRYISNAVAFLGDSITTFEGYSEPADSEYYGYYYPRDDVDEVEKTWWYQVAKGLRFDMSKVSVSAISRSSFRYQNDTTIVPAYDDRRITRLSMNQYPAVIFINMGTNDVFSSNIGTLPTTINITELNELSKTELYNAVILTIRKIQQAYSNSIIIGLIPKWCVINQSYTFSNYQKNIEVIERCYKLLGIPIIDLRNCGITQDNINTYTIDGIHPNEIGMRKIARYIVKKVLDIPRPAND